MTGRRFQPRARKRAKKLPATTARDIAKFLGAELDGPDNEVRGVCTAHSLEAGCLGFVSRLPWTESVGAGAVILVPTACASTAGSRNALIRVSHPRLAFAKAVAHFLAPSVRARLSPAAQIDRTAQVGSGVSIGHGSVIDAHVLIEDGCRIGHHVVITGRARVGRGCVIKSGTVIGEPGFGFALESDGTPVRVPHLGSVRIGDFVEIGAKCTVARGTITDTIVGDHVKTDDHVHIAHNCVIGARSILTACAELSGRVTVGERCWLGPNCSIMDGVRIGDGATVGLGAVVVEDVPAGRKVMGLGALDLRALIRLKRRIAFPND